MERIFEVLFERLVREICGEGERRIKLQAFSACLEVVLGVRGLVILTYLFCFSCFLSALSFCGAGYLLVEQWRSGSVNFLDPRLIFFGAAWLVSTGLLVFSARKGRWASAFGLQERIDELSRPQPGPGFSEEAVVRLIERVLEERDERAAREAKAARPEPEPDKPAA